ncbi:MAG: class I SAM-dependent methyltransferase [Phycisphaerae bacterium]|nr:class I SAM-dependent methyltransferase [Phycisphaerae bacterium]
MAAVIDQPATGTAAKRPVRAELIDELVARYGVGKNYARAYIEYWQESRGRQEETLAGIMARPDPEPMWFDYALSTNYRGRNLYAHFQPHFGERRGRYLDVGCGFGGCLTAFAERGFDVWGIEVAPERIALSIANCADIGLSGRVSRDDITDPAIVQRLGQFDVITCTDVIEHVLDVPGALRNMSRMLRPGGTLILEIPNMDSVAFVCSDGHFNLFGITQIDRPTAIEYHRASFDFDYDVGYYHPLRYYVNELRTLGLAAEGFASPQHAPRAPMDWAGQRAMIWEAYQRFRASGAKRVSPTVSRTLRHAVARYAAELRRNHWRRAAGLLPEGRFATRYLTDFWFLVGKSPE